MKKITVVGTGYVGLVDGVILAEKGNQVLCFDKDISKIELLKEGIPPIFENGLEELLKANILRGNIHFTENLDEAFKYSDIIIIGVGTPQTNDGNANLSFVVDAIHDIEKHLKHDCLIVIKSTVPVGTSENIDIFLEKSRDIKLWREVASNPEFLSQGTAINDALHPTRVVIGTKSQRAEKLLKELYLPFGAPIVSVSRESAEMIKYASNSFLALKISYINEVANLCEVLGADIKEVTEGMKFDPRIGSSFLNAGIGYGGSCLPKDSSAFSMMAKQKGIALNTVDAAIKTNEIQKTRLFDKAKEHFGTLKGLRISVLGLSFKPNTDDLRSAPSLKNIALFLEEGAIVSVFDPIAMPSFQKTSLSKQVTQCSSIAGALQNCQAVFIFTEWDEFRKLKPDDFISHGSIPVVFDGRNIYDKFIMEKAGIKYYSIGR